MTYWYISFATDAGFLGGTVVQADDGPHALEVATMRGLNPGGEAAILEVPPEVEGNPDMLALVNRLVSKEEMMAQGGKRLGDCSEAQQDRFGRDADIVCDACNPTEPKETP